MIFTVALAAAPVTVAAAVRSTWSPCGLSMLSTITPFGERAKGHRYAVTVTWFVLGAVVGGLSLGAVAALGAAGLRATGAPSGAWTAVALAVTLVTLASETGAAGMRLPVHHRQVNERWLDAYRPWVYGAGFGWQIGCGLATYITTAAVYLTVALGALTGSPAAAVALGGLFGLVRGVAVMLTAGVQTPGALLEFHRRFAAAGPAVARAVTAVLVLAALALLVGSPGPAALAVVGGTAVVTGALRLASRSRRTQVGAPTGSATPAGAAPTEQSLAAG